MFYDCPRCKAEKGYYCQTPKGRKTTKPHTERFMQLTSKDIEATKIKIGGVL